MTHVDVHPRYGFPISANVRNACTGCGGGPNGFIKTGRDPERDYHAPWCTNERVKFCDNTTVNSVHADQIQADADIYDDYQHGCSVTLIARQENLTPSQVYAAIDRTRRRLTQQARTP